MFLTTEIPTISCVFPMTPEGLQVFNKEGELIQEGEDSFTTGDFVYFDCMKGYELIGTNEAECTMFGSWDFFTQMPFCKSLFFCL